VSKRERERERERRERLNNKGGEKGKRVSKRERKRKKERKQARKGAMTSRRGKRKIFKFYHGTLTYGKDSVRFTSFTNLFGSAPFCIGNIIYLFLQNKLPE
jgi:hypothetical protein